MGALLGVVCFALLNWLNAEWLQAFAPIGHRGLLVLLAVVIAATASVLANRYPDVGLGAGVVLTALVIAGLLLGDSSDVGLYDDSWGTPGDVIRHAAHYPVTGAMAGMLLAVSISACRARAKHPRQPRL